MTNNYHKQLLINEQSGFTIIELLIATTVFATLLILITATFLGVTRVYYKGIVQTNTQTTTRDILQTITKGIEFSGGGSVDVTTPVDTPTHTDAITVGAITNTIGWYCIDNQAYIFTEGVEFTGTPSEVNPGLIYDSSNCPTDDVSVKADIDAVDGNTSTEMLGSNMRVDWFSIKQPDTTTPFYDVSLQIDYGSDNLLCQNQAISGINYCNSTLTMPEANDFNDNTLDSGDGRVQCKTQIGDQFCSAVSLNTSVGVEQSLN